MKSFVVLGAAALLAGYTQAHGCTAMDPEELVQFQEASVPPALFAKVKHGSPLNLQDVEVFTRAHVHSGALINYLYTFGSHFRLTEGDIAELRQNDAPADLIDYMTSRDARAPRFSF